MKARIKKTGEIVSIEDLYDDGTALVNGYYIKVSELDFEDNIDWEQRRYEIVKNITNGLLVSYLNPNVYSSTRISDICRWAVSLADGIIEELKKGGRDAND